MGRTRESVERRILVVIGLALLASLVSWLVPGVPEAVRSLAALLNVLAIVYIGHLAKGLMPRNELRRADHACIRVERPCSYRDFFRRYKFYVDGAWVGSVRTGESREFEVPPGIHTVRGTIDYAGSEELDVEVVPGGTCHVRLRVPRNWGMSPLDWGLLRRNRPDLRTGYIRIELADAD